MKLQPNRNYESNDDIQTPDWLARQIVNHFQPSRVVMEPCCGDGAFVEALIAYDKRVRRLYGVLTCEIKEGSDFLKYEGHVAYILTNPPWSMIRPFLKKSFEVADNVIFLLTINHCMTTCRYNMARDAGFGMKEILLVDWPDTFPKSGFLLGAVHWQRGHKGDIKWTDGRGQALSD